MQRPHNTDRTPPAWLTSPSLLLSFTEGGEWLMGLKQVCSQGKESTRPPKATGSSHTPCSYHHCFLASELTWDSPQVL